MKKNYSKPEITCIDIQVQQLMAGSITSTNVDGLSGGGNSGDHGITEGNSRSGFWDDEE